jgi:hypothetical protein
MAETLTTYVRRARRGERRVQPADEDERRGLVAELDLEQLDRVDLLDAAAPAVGGGEVGHEAAGVDRAPRRDPLE